MYLVKQDKFVPVEAMPHGQRPERIYCAADCGFVPPRLIVVSVKTGQELQEVLRAASKSVRKEAKLAGAPLFYMQNGNRVREDANGQKYALVVDDKGSLLEFPIE